MSHFTQGDRQRDALEQVREAIHGALDHGKPITHEKLRELEKTLRRALGHYA